MTGNNYHMTRLRQLEPSLQQPPSPACSDLRVRGLNIFTVFSKEAREREIERLRDELNRGYFDDFKELRETSGKLGPRPTADLLPAATAAEFPSLPAVTAWQEAVQLPLREGGGRRNGACQLRGVRGGA